MQTFLKRLLRGINMLKLMRDVLLIVFGYLISILLPALSDLLYPSTRHNLGVAFPLAIVAIAIVASAGIGILYGAQKLDNSQQAIQDKKDDERLKKLVKEVVKEVIQELKNGESEHINKSKNRNSKSKE
jgi:uncharacterized membrane protein required for colicin V production